MRKPRTAVRSPFSLLSSEQNKPRIKQVYLTFSKGVRYHYMKQWFEMQANILLSLGYFHCGPVATATPPYTPQQTTPPRTLPSCRGTALSVQVHGLLNHTTNFKRKLLPTTQSQTKSQSQTNYLQKKREKNISRKSMSVLKAHTWISHA